MTTNRIVAITGASAGIGRATALRLARDGATIVACARRGERLRALADEIAANGGRALPLVADVTREADMERLVRTAVDRFGQLDAILCNAGFGVYGTIDQISAAEMRAVLEVNYLGTFHAARAAMPVFRRQARGHLLVVSSIVGKRGVPFMGAYSATKFAQVGLAECLRAEVNGSNIHVSIVFPVSTDTDFLAVMGKASGYVTQAIGPRQRAEDVADAIARALDHPTPEVYPYRKARAVVLLNAIAPGLCDRVVQRWGRKPVKVS